MEDRDPDDEAADLTAAAVLAVPMAGLFALLAYPAVGIVRGVLGRRGIALSPLLTTPVVWAALLPLIHLEPAMQERPDWSRIQPYWYGGVAGLVVVPAVVGVSWPVPVLRRMPPVAAGVVCFLAPPTVLTVLSRALRR